MSTTLDSVTLADPMVGEEGYVRESVDVGARHQTADGKIHFDYTKTRYKFTLKWTGRTQAEMTTAHTEFLDALAGVVTFSPPDSAGTYNVLAVQNSWKDSYFVDGTGTARYSFEMKLEEQD